MEVKTASYRLKFKCVGLCDKTMCLKKLITLRHIQGGARKGIGLNWDDSSYLRVICKDANK